MLAIFLTAGYPNIEKSIQSLKILDEAKVDLIELGVPFSDPLADGPVIQAASHKALEAGVNLDMVFEIVQRANLKQKVILFSYYNPLYAYGFDNLIKKCKEHNVSGALIPDLPMDEAQDLCQKFKENDLTLTLLAAITSTDERLEKIAKLSEPFVYLVSRVGVTGSNKDAAELKDQKADADEERLVQVLNKLKAFTKPIGIGFGIDSAAKVRETLKSGADMAIVGTKAIRVLEEDQSADLREFRDFIHALMN